MASKVVKLSSGYDCPLLGYGTYRCVDPSQLKETLKTAVKLGYRHFDTAKAYYNESIIGEAFDELFMSGVVKREEIFLTTKLHMSFMNRGDVVDALKKQLEALKMSYVDLYLIHFPVALQKNDGPGYPVDKATGKILVDNGVKIEDTWAAMEECVKAGLARSIGVSNFNTSQLERLMKSGTIKPAMNQIESHPGFQNTKHIEFCHKHGIAVTAHSQFGAPGQVLPMSGQPVVAMDIMGDERLAKVAAKHGKSVAQVILRWQIQRNVCVIPKSVTPSRMADNLNVWDFELSADDMKAIADIDTNKRFIYLDFPGVRVHAEYPHVEAASC